MSVVCVEGRVGTEPVSHGDLLPTQVVDRESARRFEIILLQLLVLGDRLAYYGEDTLAVPVGITVSERERLSCVMLAARSRRRTS
jgi:hypothetical protein